MAPQPAAAGGVAAPASGGAPNLQQQIQEDRAKSDAAIAAMEKSQGLEVGNLQQRQREMEPLRQKALSQAMQSPPQIPKQDKPPDRPKQRDQHDDENWLFAASILGSLAGAFTRNHATNALAAFSGAMQGYQEGSKQKFDQNMKIWEAENKAVQETNKQAMDEYRDILQNRKLSMDQMSVAMRLAGEKYDDQAAVQAAKTKNSLVMAQFYDKRYEAALKMQQSADSLLEKRDEATRRENNKMAIAQMRALGVTPGQEGALIDAIGQYKQPPITGPRGAAIMNLVQEKYQDYDVKEWFDKKQRSTTDARVDAAGRTAGERVGATRATNLEAAARSAGPLVTMAAEAAKNVPATAFPRLNSIMQATAEELGDPALVRFRFANLELGRLIARVINPSSSTITNYQAQQAAELFLTANSPEGYQASLEQAKNLIEREYKAAQEQKSHAPLAPIDLPDTTQRSLKPISKAIR
jgi:hypothetical protein